MSKAPEDTRDAKQQERATPRRRTLVATNAREEPIAPAKVFPGATINLDGPWKSKP